MIRLFKQYIPVRKLIFIIGEGLLIFLAITLTSFLVLALGWGENFTDAIILIWPKVLLITIITQVSLYFNDLYEFKNTDRSLDIAARLVQAIGVTSISLAFVYFLWPTMIIGRWIFFVSLIILLFFIVSWRFLYTIIIGRKMFTEKAMILGAGGLAKDIVDEMRERRDNNYNIAFLVVNGKNDHYDEWFRDMQINYGFDRIYELSINEEIKNIIVAFDEKRGVFPYEQLLGCKVRGINIIDGVTFYERITGKLLVERINPSWFIFSDGFHKSSITRIIKRIKGLIMSTIMLVFLSPLMLLTAIIIKLESKGPVLFSQERVGEDGKPFMLYKFRSMRTDAEAKTGPVWAQEDDPRVTRVGKFIRKVRIDELPQLWNVFKGDMSFVGPRPERQFFVDELKKKIPYYNERFTVKPGVTGWAQIKYPYGATEKDALEKLKYDLYYIKNMSVVFDFMVIFQTVKTVLLGKGAR
jgi:sugar transferase (PEP-CTERM system associated)